MFFHYTKYLLIHLVAVGFLISLLVGGVGPTVGVLVLMSFVVFGDLLGGNDTATPKFKTPGLLTIQLWLTLPLVLATVFSAIWAVSPGDSLGFGAFLSSFIDYDFFAVKEASHWGHSISILAGTGLMIGMVATITAHELTHRTWDPVSMFIGRWLLSFSFDTIFSIEHVYGHHRYVSTKDDPATAPRGRNVYQHIVISTIEGNISAWELEKERLAKFGKGVFSVGNGVIRGHLMSLLLVVLAFLMGGITGGIFFIACALFAKALLEIVNFMEHYGMVRNPKVPVQPRHSWNTNKRITSWAMFNLSRHSHHHADGNVPFQDLKPYSGAPEMINGYLTTIIVTLCPPLWNHLMIPKVLEWDQKYASKEELALAKEANLASGNSVFINAASDPLYQLDAA